ncbi:MULTISPECIES: UbiH/UbiF family hydroxylase [unclassified Marinovum]
MDHDILIAGGGIAGLTAAAAFGQAGFSVLCVDPAPPVTDRDAEGADMRSTAFLQPAQAFLDSAGLWPRLAPYAMPLETMRIIDAGGTTSEARVSRDFEADDISDQPFGWNLPNWLLRREMSGRLGELPNVTFLTGVAATKLFTRTAEARVSLSDGSARRCRMVIAADGRNSALRQAAGIGVKTTRFGQKALAFAVTHPLPHGNVSTEIHRTGGPFTLVPLPDHKGRPSSAVVWMEDGPKAAALHQLGTKAFEAAMTERSTHLLGPLTLASRRSLWPIIAQHAETLSSERLALVAEAAHVLPPIGAQGLNMSLTDLSTLLELALANPEELGDAAMLDAYHRARITDIRARTAGIIALNRTSMLASQPMRDLRAAGISALHGATPVRRKLMQLGLGVRRPE